jgi:hypothetical protein
MAYVLGQCVPVIPARYFITPSLRGMGIPIDRRRVDTRVLDEIVKQVFVVL